MMPVCAVSVLWDSGKRELLAEATAAGEWSVIPKAVLFGILLGILYDGFRILRIALGLRKKEYVSAWTARLCGIRRRRIPTQGKTTRTGGEHEAECAEPPVRRTRMKSLLNRFPRLR
ncbi:MAG: spore cortex biosynthesis protein YabQ [Eubacteriales bacterium]